MAKLDNYSGSLKIPSGLIPKSGDFALMEAHQILVGISIAEDGETKEVRLDDELELLKKNSGINSGSAPLITNTSPGIVKSSSLPNRIKACDDGSGEMEIVSVDIKKITQTEDDIIVFRGKI